ncbi:hypothetical protein L1I30_12555 [Gillisia sp. M10.2A]|uniref:peptidylprolyl isomerase n=1 Tax=Gillisia lutea TaxID=2909668 RepID=A0ABS9EI04_9FLAO|nr:hypothetical protein [Gillisia lutea]MCF4102499.1 hypothetical protein [Gillisia lutea]
MMKLNKLFIIGVLTSTFFISCKNDDDTTEEVEVRDPAEQAIEDDEALIAYMQTHFYNYEEFENPPANFDYTIKFDTIAGANSGKTPIIDSDLLMTKTVNVEDIDYNVYILKIREGAGDHPTFADSTFQNYKGELLNGTTFDNTTNPVWFDLQGYVGTVYNNNGQASLAKKGGVISGFSQAMTEFGEASGFTVNPDNTVEWKNDYGVGATFFPSGLGYYANGTGSIPSYSPLVFTFKLYGVKQADHDQDGIPSYMEDLDGDENVFNDDTDEDGLPNNSDADDDNDGTPTRDEITINEDGSIEFQDKNNNGVPDHLDPDVFE